jgi:hypothetical protein
MQSRSPKKISFQKKISFKSSVSPSRELQKIEDSLKIVQLCQPRFEFYKGAFKMPENECISKSFYQGSKQISNKKLILKSLEWTNTRFTYEKDEISISRTQSPGRSFGKELMKDASGHSKKLIPLYTSPKAYNRLRMTHYNRSKTVKNQLIQTNRINRRFLL